MIYTLILLVFGLIPLLALGSVARRWIGRDAGGIAKNAGVAACALEQEQGESSIIPDDPQIIGALAWR